MRNLNILFFGIIILIVYSCSSSTTKIDNNTYLEYKKRGNEITNLTQATLLANVGSAIQKGGTEYAVEFCNLKASEIVDSLNAVNNSSISRVSDKNRNPDNNLKNSSDKTLIEYMKKGAVNDTLLLSQNKLTYYKPIRTGLAACLKCHGDPQTDIETSTMAKINKLYPNDQATGYQLNDFRGMWKVEFNFPVD